MSLPLAKYLTTFFLSIFKMYGGIFFGVASNLHFLETALFAALGSISTVAIVLFLLNRHRTFLARILTKTKRLYYHCILMVCSFLLSQERYYTLKRKLASKTKPKKSSKTIRFVVRVWKIFGISGVSFLTPLILSPIGGAIISVSFRADYKKTMIYMTLFHVCFALLFSYAFTEFGDLIEREFGINLGKQG